jgi:phosphatidylglycerol:prolipoprotein diacylglycerol transferase
VDRVAFTMPDFLGGWAVYWYGVILAAAFLTGAFYVMRRVRLFGLDSDRVFDVILVGIICAIIGARAYYVVFTWGSGMYRSVWDIFSTRNGGLAIYGGLAGAALGGALMCKIRRVKLLPLLDLAAGAVILGQAVGRWANFINIEAFGSNTGLPWGMASPVISGYLNSYKAHLESIGVAVDPAQAVHPTFLYESVWCLLGFLLLFQMTKRRRFDGQLTLTYLVWYGLGRFFIEGLRTDSLLLGSVRVSQLLALLCVLAAGITLAVVFSRIKRESDADYLKLYVDTEEGRQILAGDFYKKKPGPAAGEAEAPEGGDSADKDTPEDAEDEPAGACGVVLTGAGENKIALIQLIRELTGLGLAEAKGLAENPPGPVLEGVTRAEAQDALRRLEEAGASAEILGGEDDG